jgi:hypothetical protein
VILYNKKLTKKKFHPIYHSFLLLLDSLEVRASLILSDRLTETLFYVFIIKITLNILPYELDICILRIKSEFFFIKTYVLDRLYIGFLKTLFLRRTTSRLFLIKI